MIDPLFLLSRDSPWFRQVLPFFSPVFYVVAKLTDEFTSLEEPTNDSDTVIVLVLLADGSEGRIEPKDPMQKFRLPIIRSISWFPLTSRLLFG
jgi:hypothetical protein